MKKTLSLVFMLAVVMNASAAGYGELEMPGWLTFMGIVIIVFGILEIVLFFKIWAMTDNVKAMKQYFLKETKLEEFWSIPQAIRNNLLMERTDKVISILLSNFSEKVDKKFESLPLYGSNGEKLNKDMRLDMSIEEYVKNLEKQFNKIGVQMPVFIANMKTFRDFYYIFTEEDLNICSEKEKSNE